MLRVRRAVGAEKKFRATGNGGLDQRLTMRFAFQHRQAIQMRTNTAGEHGVAVVEQMVRSDRGSDIGVGALYKLYRLASGDMFKHNFEARVATKQRQQHAINEHGFAIKNIHRRVGHFAMQQQRQAGFFHRRKHRFAAQQIGHARVRVRRRARRIIFHRMHEPTGFCTLDFVGAGIVGEVERHQRLELNPGGNC